MGSRWIVNASPIIALAKIDRLQLLQELCDEVLVPRPVGAEILAGPPSDPARRILEQGWGIPVSAESVPSQILEWGLGAGETAVLALAMERKPATAVLDDAAARTCAKVLKIEVIGTLGVVLRAKRKALIPSAAETIQSLCAAGLHVDQQVIRAALHGIGETWECR